MPAEQYHTVSWAVKITKHRVPCDDLASPPPVVGRELRGLILRVSAPLKYSRAASPVASTLAPLACPCLGIWRNTAGGTRAVPTPVTHAARPPSLYLQAGVVAIWRQRELRAAVVSQLVHQQIVLALVATRSGSRGSQSRAAPPGHEPRALAHGRDRAGLHPGSRGWGPGKKGPSHLPNCPEQSDAPERKMREEMQTPGWLAGWLGCASGFPARQREKSLLRGSGDNHQGNLDLSASRPLRQAAPCSQAEGTGGASVAAARESSFRVTMSTATLQPLPPAFFPHNLRHDPHL